MSFGSACDACGIAYSSRGARGFFPDRSPSARPTQWRMLADVTRFYRDARRVIDAPVPSIGDARRLDGRTRLLARVSRPFPGPDHVGGLVHGGGPDPSSSRSTTSSTSSTTTASSATGTRRSGGSYAVARRRTSNGWSRGLRRDRSARAIRSASVARDAFGVRIATRPGRRRGSMPSSWRPTPTTRSACSTTPTTASARCSALSSTRRIEVVLHTDDRVLPSNPRARGSWNVRTPDCRRAGRRAHDDVPHEPAAIDRTGRSTTACRSIRATSRPAIGHRERACSAIRCTRSERSRRRRGVGELQGRRRTWFAGAHLGYGFHEDGCRSGFEAAEMIGRPREELAA